MTALEARRLGKRYGHFWALENCDLAIPGGSVVALVGPNGAGKSTLLHLAVGLAKPTAGEITVLGGEPAGSPQALDGIGFVAQDAPLYKNLSVEETLRLGRHLNQTWDQKLAIARMAALGMRLKQKVGKLSGGQQSQLALTVALAKRPRLLILDEPVARLDPVARHDFMGSLMESVSEEGIAVVLSSHVVSELERVADYLVVLNHGAVRLAGPTADLLSEHMLMTGPSLPPAHHPASLNIIHEATAKGYSSLLVRARNLDAAPAGWQYSDVGLEELVLAYLRQPANPDQGHRAAYRLQRTSR
jgi:ABC-2 type transport system ATP-binding protein